MSTPQSGVAGLGCNIDLGVGVGVGLGLGRADGPLEQGDQGLR